MFAAARLIVNILLTDPVAQWVRRCYFVCKIRCIPNSSSKTWWFDSTLGCVNSFKLRSGLSMFGLSKGSIWPCLSQHSAIALLKTNSYLMPCWRALIPVWLGSMSACVCMSGCSVTCAQADSARHCVSMGGLFSTMRMRDGSSGLESSCVCVCINTEMVCLPSFVIDTSTSVHRSKQLAQNSGLLARPLEVVQEPAQADPSVWPDAECHHHIGSCSGICGWNS